MATLTRFFSTSEVPAAINQVKADPGAVAAGAASAGAIAEALGQGLSAIGQGLSKMEKQQGEVDQLYLANAKSQLEVGMYDVIKQAQANMEVEGNASQILTQQFDQLALKQLESAPNDKTRESLTRSIMSLRNTAFMQGQRMQDKYNEFSYLKNFDDNTADVSSYLLREPDKLQAGIKRLSQAAEGLRQKGVDSITVEKKMEQAIESLTLQSYKARAANDPETILARLQDGQFSDKGARFEQALRDTATQTINNRIKQTEKVAKGISGKLASGVAIAQEEWDAVLNNQKYLPEESRTSMIQLKSVYDYLNLLKPTTDPQTGLPRLSDSDFQGLRAEIRRMAINDSSMTPEILSKTMGLIDAREKLFKENPLEYFQNFNPSLVTPVDKSLPLEAGLRGNTDQARAFIDQRVGMANNLEKVTGQETILPFTSAELSTIKREIGSLEPIKQAEKLAFFLPLGADRVNKLATEVFGKDSMVGVITTFGKYDKALTEKMLRGEKYMSGPEGAKLASAIESSKMGPAIGNLMGDLFQENPSVRQNISRAVTAYLAEEMVSQKKTPSLVTDTDIKRALKEITGLDKVVAKDFWGPSNAEYTTLLPVKPVGPDKYQRVTKDEFTSTLKEFKDPNLFLKYGNGVPLIPYQDMDNFNPERENPSEFKYIPNGNGNYLIYGWSRGESKWVPLPTVTGQPAEVNIEKYLSDKFFKSNPVK